MGRYEEAEEVGDALLAIEPNNRLAQGNMADLMARQGRIDEALRFIQDHDLKERPQAVFVYAAAGLREELERVIEIMEPRSGLKIWLVHGYALLGDAERLLRNLKLAIDNHDPILNQLIGHGPYHDCTNFDGVKLGTIYDGEEVQGLLRQINFDQQSISCLKI